MTNPMRNIVVEKVCLNIGVGEPGDKLEKAVTLLKRITEAKVVKTKAKKREPAFKLRPGLEIGAKVTIRDKKAIELLKRLLSAVDNTLKESQFDNEGNVSFGVKEYIYIPGIKYDPKMGIIGFDVNVSLKRPGYRIKRKTYRGKSIGKKHKITKEEAIEFIKSKFEVEIT